MRLARAPIPAVMTSRRRRVIIKAVRGSMRCWGASRLARAICPRRLRTSIKGIEGATIVEPVVPVFIGDAPNGGGGNERASAGKYTKGSGEFVHAKAGCS